MARSGFVLSLAVVAAAAAACGGGGGGSAAPPVVTPPTATAAATPTPTPTPVATVAPLSTQQVVSMALPSTAIGTVSDPTYGTVGGYTQTEFSQVLGFAPGTQIMVRNGDVGTPHTLSVVSTSGFTASPTLSVTAAGGNTIGSGFSSGSVAPGALAGPFTLAAGTFWLGCAYHYASNTMRTVLVVAAAASAGPAATPPPNTATPAPYSTGGGFGY